MRRAADVAGRRPPTRSPREVAAATTVVFTALPNDAIVRETYLGPSGLLAGGRAGPGDLRLLHREPRRHARESTEAATARGIHHLDTPMLGSTPQAESGEIFFMVGGDERPDARDPAAPRRDGAAHDARRALRAPATASSSSTTRSAR